MKLIENYIENLSYLVDIGHNEHKRYCNHTSSREGNSKAR